MEPTAHIVKSANKIIQNLYTTYFDSNTLRGRLYTNTIGNMCIDMLIERCPYVRNSNQVINILTGKNGRGEKVLDENFFEYVRDRCDEKGFTYDVALKEATAANFVVTLEMYD